MLQDIVNNFKDAILLELKLIRNLTKFIKLIETQKNSLKNKINFRQYLIFLKSFLFNLRYFQLFQSLTRSQNCSFDFNYFYHGKETFIFITLFGWHSSYIIQSVS